MIAGCYSLDLYCDNERIKHPYGEFPHQFTGETFGECARTARARGWIISRDRSRAICPMCSGKKRGWRRAGRGGE